MEETRLKRRAEISHRKKMRALGQKVVDLLRHLLRFSSVASQCRGNLLQLFYRALAPVCPPHLHFSHLFEVCRRLTPPFPLYCDSPPSLPAPEHKYCNEIYFGRFFCHLKEAIHQLGPNHQRMPSKWPCS